MGDAGVGETVPGGARLDDRDDGRPRPPRQGTLQGDVISPLLANVYLHLLDRNFRLRVQRGDLHGRSFAMRTISLCYAAASGPSTRVDSPLMARLGLTLHRGEGAGARCETRRFRLSGPHASLAVSATVSRRPPKAYGRIRDELRRKTRLRAETPEMIAELNPYIRGARHYFRRVRRRTLNNSIALSNQRIARWYARNMGVPGRHGRSCPAMIFAGTTDWNSGICRPRFDQLTQGPPGERRGKPYAGNPHVRFDEGLLARRVSHGGPGSTPPDRTFLEGSCE